MKIKKILQNILLLFLSIALALIAIEIVARQMDNNQYLNNILFSLTDYSIFVYKPDTHINYDRGEFVVDVKINSKGIRDYEYDYNKKAGVKRIVMLGDSYIAAEQVPLEKSVSKKLEELLNKNPKIGKYEVLNFGHSGVGPTHEIILLEKEGIKYEPDIVILNFYVGNDYVKVDFGVSGSIPKEVFEDNDDLENISLPVTKIQKFKSYLFRNYFTYTYIQKLIANINSKGFNDQAYIDATIYQKHYPVQIEKNLEKAEVILRHLKRYTDKKGIKLLVVLVPAREQVDERKLSELVKKFGFDKSQMDIQKAQRILLQFGKESNIPMLDLLPEFKKRNMNNTFYFETDGHWNDKGHELAAELIYKRLIGEGFITS